MANRVKGNKAKSGKGTEKQDNTELLESSEALRDTLVGKTGSFFKSKKNQNLVLGIGAVLALAIAGVFGYTYYIESQNEAAQNDMFQATFYFESDSLNLALNGDGNNYGFLEIIDEYGGTEAANLASYYAGVSYLKQGQYDAAVDYLSDFSSSDFLVQARAYALIGDAYMEQENFQQAADYYEQAANYKPNEFFTPQYLVKAGLAYEAIGDYATAAESYSQIVEEYPESAEYQQALKQQTRLESMAAAQ